MGPLCCWSISVILVGTKYPFADASTQQILDYFASHRSAFMSVVMLELVALALLMAFVAGYAGHARVRSTPTASLLLITGASTVLAIAFKDASFASAGFMARTEAVAALWPLGHFGFGVIVHLFTATWLACACLFVRQAPTRTHLIATPAYVLWLLSAGVDLVSRRETTA